MKGPALLSPVKYQSFSRVESSPMEYRDEGFATHQAPVAKGWGRLHTYIIQINPLTFWIGGLFLLTPAGFGWLEKYRCKNGFGEIPVRSKLNLLLLLTLVVFSLPDILAFVLTFLYHQWAVRLLVLFCIPAYFLYPSPNVFIVIPWQGFFKYLTFHNFRHGPFQGCRQTFHCHFLLHFSHYPLCHAPAPSVNYSPLPTSLCFVANKSVSCGPYARPLPVVVFRFIFSSFTISYIAFWLLHGILTSFHHL